MKKFTPKNRLIRKFLLVAFIFAALNSDHLVGFAYAHWWVNQASKTWVTPDEKSYAFIFEGFDFDEDSSDLANAMTSLRVHGVEELEKFPNGKLSAGIRIKRVAPIDGVCKAPYTFYSTQGEASTCLLVDKIKSPKSKYQILISMEHPVGLARLLCWPERTTFKLIDNKTGNTLQEVRALDFKGGLIYRLLAINPDFGKAPMIFIKGPRSRLTF